MKEIRDIIAQYDELGHASTPLVLATVFDVKGSSYRRTGARMLIQHNGNWTGGISGGCIEGNALKQASLVLMDKKARVVTYDTENDDESSIGVSLGCNGIISVLFSSIDRHDSLNQIEVLREVSDHRSQSILLTIVSTTNDKLIPGSTFTSYNIPRYIEDKSIIEDLKKAVIKVKKNSKSLLQEIDGHTFFIEYIPPELNLIVMGGNYDVYPLLYNSRLLGWKNIVIYNPKRLYEKARSLADTLNEDFSIIEIDDYTVAVIMSHDYNADLANLRKALNSELKYIGLLGPAVRKQDMINALKSEGMSVDESRIFGPAGLDIGAAQPDEIAVAIISEIISFIRGRNGQSLRKRHAPIHDR